MLGGLLVDSWLAGLLAGCLVDCWWIAGGFLVGWVAGVLLVGVVVGGWVAWLVRLLMGCWLVA